MPTDLSSIESFELKVKILIGAADAASKKQLINFEGIRRVCELALFQELHLPPEKARALLTLAIDRPEGMTGAKFKETLHKTLTKMRRNKKVLAR